MTKVKIDVTSHNEFINHLVALNKISSPKQKIEVLTQALPYFARKNQGLGGTLEQIQARDQALEKTQRELVKLKAIRPLDPAAIQSLTKVGSAFLLNTAILVREANWSMWNPLLYVVSFGLIAIGDVAYNILNGVCCGPRPAQEEVKGDVKTHENRIFTGSELAENPPEFQNANKQTAYSILMENPPSIREEEVTLEKVTVDQDIVLNAKVFSPQPLKLNLSEGFFSYPPGPSHWTANFGDPNVFFGCLTSLAAQDEIQTLEHPVLSHVYTAAKKDAPDLLQLEEGSSLLVQGALRRGVLDTQISFKDLIGFPSEGTLYGKNFRRAKQEHIQSALKKIEPQKSNLFVICAPNVSSRAENELYDPETIFRMLQTAYSAFRAIQEKDSEATLHLGNWGCGAFGHEPTLSILVQVAAARMAGIKEVCFYPLKEIDALNNAISLIVHLEKEFPNITGKEFASLLWNLAKPMNFRFHKGDGN
jgi:hypothetical protein